MITCFLKITYEERAKYIYFAKGLCKISITQPLISHRGLQSLLVKASPNTKGVGMTQDTEACQTQTHGQL